MHSSQEDDYAIFQRELQGLDLDGTFDVSFTPEDSSNDTFVKSQHRYVIEKKLTSSDSRMTRYEIKTERSTHVAILELYDLWHSIKLVKGMLINIVDVQPNRVGSCDTFKVDRSGGFVVVEPDILVSVTSVLNQLWCERKTTLGEFFRFSFDSEVMLRGTIAHDLIGRAMVDKITNKEKLQELIKQCISSPPIMNTAYACKLTHQETFAMATELIPYVEEFVKNRILNQAKDQNVKINKVCDIEDTYWNPIFGLKGKLDATIRILDKKKQEKIVPLEFKIGNEAHKGKRLSRHEHVGQVCLYNLLMRPRYGMINGGLLLYIREDLLKECTVPLGDLQSLIILRNNLAQSTISVKGELSNIPRPGGIDFDFKCDRCEMKNTCALMWSDKDLSTCSDTEQRILQSIDHLLQSEISFFNRWMKIITLEMEEADKTTNLTNIWKTKAATREKHGQCITNLEFVHISPVEVIDAAGNRCYKLTLKKTGDDKSAIKTLLTEGDVVILSTQDELCISYCSIEAMSKHHITLTLERKLNERSSRAITRFTIDRIVSKKVIQIQYANLSLLMEPTPHAQRLRSYIIENKSIPNRTNPQFSNFKTSNVVQIQPFLFKYNDDQRRAILKAVSTDSFLFVKGMPGTGKTETIIGLLKLLSHQNYNVLVVAYTNNALDNILLKYKRYRKDFLRVGSPSKLKPESLEQFSTNWMSKTCTNIDELTNMYNSKRIVGSTLMSLQHEIFRIRTTFDYCIIDEASQALPTCVFGALMLAKKFVLFGDPDQLPAIIKSPAVKNMRVEDSMFALVSEPVNTVELSIQYRMNSEIMNLANKLVYKDQMTCANEEQSESFVDLPSKTLKDYVYTLPSHKIQRWVSAVVSKKMVKSVIFLETSAWNAPEEKIGESVRNIHEANIVRTCIDSFVTCGYSGANIGVIAPFRGQVTYLRQVVQGMGVKFKYVEVNTVDQYQGRDKDIIICSFTKSKSLSSKSPAHINKNLVGEEPELKAGILQDIRRLNVAITRAKKKLIMIGNQDTLKEFESFKRLFPLLKPEQLMSISDS